jgi:hypothetical protein
MFGKHEVHHTQCAKLCSERLQHDARLVLCSKYIEVVDVDGRHAVVHQRLTLRLRCAGSSSDASHGRSTSMCSSCEACVLSCYIVIVKALMPRQLMIQVAFVRCESRVNT